MDAKFEALYRKRLWKTSRTSRRGGVICAFVSVAVHMFLISRHFIFATGGGASADATARAIPSVVCCLLSLTGLSLGLTTRMPWVIQNWSPIAFAAVTPLLLTLSSAYAPVPPVPRPPVVSNCATLLPAVPHGL